MDIEMPGHAGQREPEQVREESPEQALEKEVVRSPSGHTCQHLSG